MTLSVVDALGITFRPSGARTRLVNLLDAYRRRSDAFDVRVVATAGRGAPQVLEGVDVDVVEIPSRRAPWSLLARRGPAFDDADLIHLETMPIPLIAPHRPLLLTIHDLRATSHPQLGSSRLKTTYERHLLPSQARRLAALVAVSEATAADARDHLSIDTTRIHVVPNGIIRTSAVPQPVAGPPYVLAFGHIEPRKNLTALLPAMADVARRPGMPSRLVVAGRDLGGASDLQAAYESLREARFDLVIETSVSEARRLELLAGASCLVAPSLAEGFGLVPLEALAAGTPPVVSDLPATREVLGAAARYFDLATDGAMAEAIFATLSTPDTTMSEADAVLDRHSWDAAAAALHQVWARCTKTP